MDFDVIKRLLSAESTPVISDQRLGKNIISIHTRAHTKLHTKLWIHFNVAYFILKCDVF